MGKTKLAGMRAAVLMAVRARHRPCDVWYFHRSMCIISGSVASLGAGVSEIRVRSAASVLPVLRHVCLLAGGAAPRPFRRGGGGRRAGDTWGDETSGRGHERLLYLRPA